MNNHLLAPHLDVFYSCFEYTEILGLQLMHVHLTASITVKHHQIRTSIIIRILQNEHRLWNKFDFNICIYNIRDISASDEAIWFCR